MSRWKKSKFRIAGRITTGGKRWSWRVGMTWDIWAVDERPDGWYLTHLPSGYCIRSPQPTRRKAQAMARALSAVRGAEKLTGNAAVKRFPKIAAEMGRVLNNMGVGRTA